MNTYKNIEKLYKKSGYFNKYGGELILTICIIIIFTCTFSYIHLLNNIEPIKKNWALERCNPLYMPFAGWINNTSNNKSNLDYTRDNFNTCLQNASNDMAQYHLNPISFIINSISDTFKGLSDIISGLISFFSTFITTLIYIITFVYEALLNSTTEISRIIIKIKDTFKKITTIMILSIWVQILTFRLSIAWFLLTPIFQLFFIIVPSYDALSASIIQLNVTMTQLAILTSEEIVCTAEEVTAGVLMIDPLTITEGILLEAFAVPCAVSAQEELILTTILRLIPLIITIIFLSLVFILNIVIMISIVIFNQGVLGAMAKPGMPLIPV